METRDIEPGRDETPAARVLAPRVWCRQRWCRDDAAAEHFAGDGCSCDPHGRAAVETAGGDETACLNGGAAGAPEPEVPRLTVLKAHASRLPAFACRSCGCASRRMVEYPTLFFRCEPCAAANRWPDTPRSARR